MRGEHIKSTIGIVTDGFVSLVHKESDSFSEASSSRKDLLWPHQWRCLIPNSPSRGHPEARRDTVPEDYAQTAIVSRRPLSGSVARPRWHQTSATRGFVVKKRSH
jgi:hypothetical protein